MNKLFKKITALVISMAMLLSTNLIYAKDFVAGGNIYFNDQLVGSTDLKYLSQTDNEGVIFVPIRVIAEELGYEINWNNTDNSINLSKESTEIKMTIDNYTALFDEFEWLLNEKPVIVNNYAYSEVEDVFYLLLDDFAVIDVIDNDVYVYSYDYYVSVYDSIYDYDDYTNDFYFSDEYMSMFIASAISTIESDEFIALLNFIISSENFKGFTNDIFSSEYFIPVISELLYSETYFALMEEMESIDGYNKYVEDCKALDSYKKVSEETGYSDLFLDPRQLDIDEYLEYMTNMVKAPSYLEFNMDCLKLDSYYEFFKGMSSDNSKLNSLISEYMTEIENSENLLNFGFDISESAYIEPLMTEIENSKELEDFMSFMENMFNPNDLTDEDIEELLNEFMIELMQTDAFSNLIAVILESENFNATIAEVLNSENFLAIYEQILSTGIIESLESDMENLDVYIQFTNDVEALQSYQNLLEEIGYTAEEVDNASPELNIEIALKMLKSPNYINLQLESMQLDSYKALNDYMLSYDFSESEEALIEIFESEEFYALVNELTSSENFNALMTEIQSTPEFQEVMSLYMEFIYSLMQF